MQTFLPYPNLLKSARCLDNKRLGKQRVEAMQIHKAIHDPNYGWQNHPAVNMWRGYTKLLALYHDLCIFAWTQRGFRNNMPLLTESTIHTELKLPTWYGNEEFHASHRSNLLRKDPIFYGQYGWKEPHDLPYWWPPKVDIPEITQK